MIQNIKDIPPVEKESPKGKYKISRRSLFQKLENSSCPFDVEHVTLPAGKMNFPFHSHEATWELYLVLSGEGVARIGESEHSIGPGDHFLCPPGCAHQIRATTDMLYIVAANNSPVDLCHYPDSQKWGVFPLRKCFRESVDYYDGEE